MKHGEGFDIFEDMYSDAARLHAEETKGKEWTQEPSEIVKKVPPNLRTYIKIGVKIISLASMFVGYAFFILVLLMKFDLIDFSVHIDLKRTQSIQSDKNKIESDKIKDLQGLDITT
jgi:hypothetical protein